MKAVRRNTGNTTKEEVMNSHTAALNLQSTGHRGFPQVTSTSNNSNECPWFLPHQMPPTAPARQHKRPAPQPGVGSGNTGGTTVLTQQQQTVTSNISLQNTTTVGPPITHPHPPIQNNNLLNQPALIPPQLPPHTANMVINFIYFNYYL